MLQPFSSPTLTLGCSELASLCLPRKTEFFTYCQENIVHKKRTIQTHELWGKMMTLSIVGVFTAIALW
jgi:hypothetical protein